MNLHRKYVPGLLAALAVSVMMFAGAPSHAVILVSDTWDDGTDDDPASPDYAENGGVVPDGDGELESAWFNGGNGTLDPVGAGGPERGAFVDGTVTSSASWTTYFTPESGQVVLANTDDQIKVTWVFQLTNINAQNSSQNLRLALVDTPGADRISSGSPGSADYTGYGMFINVGQLLGRSDPFELMERADTNGALLSSSGEWAPLIEDGDDDATGYAEATDYTFMMSITRTALGELQVDASMAGGSLNGTGLLSVSFLDTTPNNGGYTFDTFSLRPSGATSTAEIFDTSLFQVEFIPEPASIALLGLGTLLVTARRARR